MRPESAAVTAKTVNVAAPSIGRITFLNEKREVSFGEPLMTVNPAVGNPITVECLAIGSRSTSVSPMAILSVPAIRWSRLMRADAPIVVSATVGDNLTDEPLRRRDRSLVYSDGTSVGRPKYSGFRQRRIPGRSAARALTVLLAPKKALSPEMIGQPVEVKFDLFGDSMIGRLVAVATSVWPRGTGNGAFERRGEVMSIIRPVVLCGGSGTRLWPLSRRASSPSSSRS